MKWKRILAITAIIIAICVSKFVWHRLRPRQFEITGQTATLHLKGGTLECPVFKAVSTGHRTALGIVVLGTGDGGWSYWENNTALALSEHGYHVIGWDCRKFADTRAYNHDDLIDGFKAAVEGAKSL
jgi:alpha-beta hydrolase superfamily lysophospholipase